MAGADSSLEGGLVAAFSLFLMNYLFKKNILFSQRIFQGHRWGAHYVNISRGS